jgi:ParB family chromosome partitioning protein
MRSSATELREVPVTSIESNRYQPRRQFDEDSLVALSESIRVVGVLQPVLLRPLDDDRYELVAGERRWRAARRAGLSTIPAIVRPTEELASLEQALVENLHRQDLTALEEAAAYLQLMEDFGLTQEAVAGRVGKSRSAVANTLRLFQLPPSIQGLLRDRRLSAGHARALLATPDRSFQESLARRICDEGLSVRQAEEAVRRQGDVEDPPSTAGTTAAGGTATVGDMTTDVLTTEDAGGSLAEPEELPPWISTRPTFGILAEEPDHRAASRDQPGRGAADGLPPAGLLELEQLLEEYLDTAVQVTMGKGRGRISIAFATLEDLERIYRLMAAPRAT